MENLSVDSFNFEKLKEAIGEDPFAKKTKSYKDERFYTLTKDKNGNGAALIRFLPDSEKRIMVEMNKINTTVVKNGKKRFISKFSPSTIGLPCPFQEKWAQKWNSGDKEGAKMFARTLRYLTNIKVLKDPANPENEGKIFLFEMSGKMKDKIAKAMNPSEQDRELGKTPKQLFNPIKGNSFRLVAQKGQNGQINYDLSEIVPEENSIYNSVEEAIEDINKNTYKLSDLLKPESFPSYEEFKRDLKWVMFEDVEETTEVQEAQPVQTTQESQESQTQESQTQEAQKPQGQTEQPKQTGNDLDSILQGLI